MQHPTIHSEQLGAIDVLSNVHILVIGTTAVGGIKTELKAHSTPFVASSELYRWLHRHQHRGALPKFLSWVQLYETLYVHKTKIEQKKLPTKH